MLPENLKSMFYLYGILWVPKVKVAKQKHPTHLLSPNREINNKRESEIWRGSCYVSNRDKKKKQESRESNLDFKICLHSNYWSQQGIINTPEEKRKYKYIKMTRIWKWCLLYSKEGKHYAKIWHYVNKRQKKTKSFVLEKRFVCFLPFLMRNLSNRPAAISTSLY